MLRSDRKVVILKHLFWIGFINIFCVTCLNATTEFFRPGESGVLTYWSNGSGGGTTSVSVGGSYVFNGILGVEIFSQTAKKDSYTLGTQGIALSWAVLKQTPQCPLSGELSFLASLTDMGSPSFRMDRGDTIGVSFSLSHEMTLNESSRLLVSGGVSRVQTFSFYYDSFFNTLRIKPGDYQNICHADLAYVYNLTSYASIIGVGGLSYVNNLTSTSLSLALQGKF
jgi:hypothetical protein